MRRKIVYLDTQDYSNMQDALSGRGAAHLVPIYQELHRIAQEGQFSFCFSYTMVGEVLQLSAESIEIARRKAEVVESLCGSQCFPMVWRLLAEEMVVAARKRGIEAAPFASLEEVTFGGQWIRVELPDAETFGARFSRQRTEATARIVHEKLGRQLNRSERRHLSKLTASPTDARKAVQSDEAYPLIVGTPLEDKFVSAIIGKHPVDQLLDEFFRFVARPTKLVVAHDKFHPLAFLNQQIKGLNEVASRMFREVRGAFDRAYAIGGAEALRSRRKIVDEMLDGFLPGIVKSIKAHLVRYGVPAEYFDCAGFAEDLPKLPFAQTWRSLSEPYLLSVTDPAPTRRKIKDNDIADFTHALYMPHCAVWRTDKDYANFAAPTAKRLGCTVVRKLEELPGVLRELGRSQE